MPDTPLPTLAPLKGPAFANALAQLCASSPNVTAIDGPRHRRILVPAMWGGELLWAIMTPLLHALRMRGGEPIALLCDAHLPACTARKIDHVEPACTRWCHANADPFAQAARLRHHWYSACITDEQIRRCDALADVIAIDDLATLTYRGIELGEMVRQSLESHHRIGLAELRDGRVSDTWRDFLRSALRLVHIAEYALTQWRIDKVLMCDGLKIDWGVFRAVAQRMNIPVDVLQLSAEGRSLRFETDRPPRLNQAMPEWERWRQTPLTPEQDQAVDELLSERETRPLRSSDFCSWTRRLDAHEVRRHIGVPSERSAESLVFGMFPNVAFDAARTARQPAFRAAIDWIAQTVEFFRDQPRHHLIVRVHPAERMLDARDRIAAQVRQRCAPVPANVHVADADSPVTALGVVRTLDVALVYTSTVAMEAAALGVPVVLVGGGWNAQRGITHDMSTPQAYFQLLADLCAGRTHLKPRTEAARRFIYSMFHRTFMPTQWFTQHNNRVLRFDIDSLDALMPGIDPCMDAICRGVLCDQPFVNPLSDGPALLSDAQPRTAMARAGSPAMTA